LQVQNARDQQQYLPLSSYEICTILVHQTEAAKPYKNIRFQQYEKSPQLHHAYYTKHWNMKTNHSTVLKKGYFALKKSDFNIQSCICDKEMNTTLFFYAQILTFTIGLRNINISNI